MTLRFKKSKTRSDLFYIINLHEAFYINKFIVMDDIYNESQTQTTGT